MLQQSFPARRWLLFILLLAVQGCSQGKYIYWKTPLPAPVEAVNGLLAYQYIALNQLDDSAVAAYCLQLTTQRSPGYQLFLLQLSCAQRWLAQQSNRAVPEFLLQYCAGAPLTALHMLESGEADNIEALLNGLSAFFADTQSLSQTVKQLEQATAVTTLLGWFLRRRLLPQLADVAPARILAIHQLYSRWCRDEIQILGQNKQLALSAFLTELKRLQG